MDGRVLDSGVFNVVTVGYQRRLPVLSASAESLNFGLGFVWIFFIIVDCIAVKNIALFRL